MRKTLFHTVSTGKMGGKSVAALVRVALPVVGFPDEGEKEMDVDLAVPVPCPGHLFLPSASPLGLRPPKSGRPTPNSPISMCACIGFLRVWTFPPWAHRRGDFSKRSSEAHIVRSLQRKNTLSSWKRQTTPRSITTCPEWTPFRASERRA